MAGPLYFFPRLTADALRDGSRLSAEVLTHYGLRDVLGDIENVDSQTSMFDLRGKGPGDATGVLLTVFPVGKPPPRLSYSPDRQQWQLVQRTPELWLGVDSEYVTVPADLARVRQVPGTLVHLADGTQWLVPIVRSDPVVTGRMTCLPQDIYHDADGQVVAALKPAFHDLWRLSGEVWDLCFGGQEMPWEMVLNHCLRFLGVNYRVGRFENSVLRLIDTSEMDGRPIWLNILRAVLDIPFMEQVLEKKKQTGPDGTNSPQPDAA